ncbi:MAG: RecX family transcriptional regulator [Chloroflexota bacterium]|nr:RecX family transcriptional regulator [Chloroflexota bacterium]
MERVITAIEAQKRNKQRVSIYLDGKFAFGLSRFVAGWLEPGRKLTESEIRKLQEEDTYEVAFQKALHFINHRPRSIEETRRRLLKKGFSEEVVILTTEKLLEKHWLDDLEFARQWIENRNTFRPRSNRLLTYELRLKGVADHTIKQALEKYGGDENELSYQAGINKAQKCSEETKLVFRKKVGGFLGRRGFHYGIVRPAVDRLWKEFSSTEGERLENTDKME